MHFIYRWRDSKYCELVLYQWQLKHARFWGAEGNRKWAIFAFNLPPHIPIHIAKYLFSIRDQ